MKPNIKILVCGSRGNFPRYREKVFEELDKRYAQYGMGMEIIEGCCPNSADQYAEEWANEKGIKLHHHPVQKGESPLKRDMDMLVESQEIIAYYDGYSYGTSFMIANALMMDEEHPPTIINLKRK